jgi:anti-sigma regulatory factor (Ser/Thr protein kinase)
LRVEAEFQSEAGTVRLARQFVAETLAAWKLDHLDEVACLLVSELAANAVCHAGHAYRVAIQQESSELRIEVIDRSPVLPRPSPVTLDRDAGRGLLLVQALAAGWGARPVGEGKSVWFALPTEHETSPPEQLRSIPGSHG